MIITKNGNYEFSISEDGTKIRTFDDNIVPIAEYPESMDIKITNKCNNNCQFCHEQSNSHGNSFKVEDLISLLSAVPIPQEIALGGGNPLECREDIKILTKALPNKIFNMTVNARDINTIGDLTSYITAFGISYVPELHDSICNWCRTIPNQTVIHMIAGVHTIDDMEKCIYDFDRILILGYKQVGRGKDFYSQKIEQNIRKWHDKIAKFLKMGKIVAFDNLAIKQLGIQRLFNPEKWKKLYMGDDGQFTMYLDMVEHKFAISSTHKRMNIDGQSIKEMFNTVQILSKKQSLR